MTASRSDEASDEACEEACDTCPSGFAFSRSGDLAFEPAQRPHGIDGDPPVRRLAEQVVEDFKRQRARVPGPDRAFEEADSIQLPLSRKVAMMPRPFDDAQIQSQRVGHLDEEDTIAGKLRDSREIVPQGEGVETVENQSERRMRGPLDDLQACRHRLTCRPQDSASKAMRMPRARPARPAHATGRPRARDREGPPARCSSRPARAACPAPPSGRTCARRAPGCARCRASGIPS